MKIKELMERCGTNETGRVIAYVKDGLEEINMLTEVNTTLERFDLIKDKRFYEVPNEMIKMLDIRVKSHLNSKDEYRTIPRTIHKPTVKDGDNI